MSAWHVPSNHRPFVSLIDRHGDPLHVRCDQVQAVWCLGAARAKNDQPERTQIVICGLAEPVMVRETAAEVLRRIAEAENAPG